MPPKKRVVVLIHAECDVDIGVIDTEAWKGAIQIEHLNITNVQVAAEKKKVKGKVKEGTRVSSTFGRKGLSG